MTVQRRPRRSRPVIWLLATPTVLTAALFAWVADNPFAAAVVGALVGFGIGIALLAFPDLDRGGPSDNEDFMH